MRSFKKSLRRFEQLEDRRLLAGDVQIMTSGGDLRIYGTSGDDHVEVRLNDDGDVTVFGVNGTTVEGGSSYVAFENGTVPDDIFAYLGSGDDSIRIEDIRVGDDVILNGQRGQDALGLYQVEVGDDLRIYGGNGDTAISLDNTTVQDDLAIYTRGGDDTIGIDQSSVGDYTFVYADGGDDRVVIRDSLHDGIANLILGGGDNFLAVEGDTRIAGRTFVSAGAGNDSVYLQGATFEGRIFAFGGWGDNTLEDAGADIQQRPFVFGFDNGTIDLDGATAAEAADAALLDLVGSKARLGTIAELALLTEDLSTLVGALSSAGLVGALNDPAAELTVFAPVNSAFPSPLPPLVTDNLSSILLFHVTGGVIESSDVLAGLENGDITVTMLNEEQLVIPSITNLNNQGISLIVEGLDIRAKNGIIHLIDGVLLPPSLTS